MTKFGSVLLGIVLVTSGSVVLVLSDAKSVQPASNTVALEACERPVPTVPSEPRGDGSLCVYIPGVSGDVEPSFDRRPIEFDASMPPPTGSVVHGGNPYDEIHDCGLNCEVAVSIGPVSSTN
jgi:hypothetical protein